MSEQRLPSKTLILWQIRVVIIEIIILGILTRYFHTFSWFSPLIIALIILFSIALIWYVPALLKAYTIKYVNGAVVIESGVFIKVTHIMPFSKMIYTQSITTPIARFLGLSAVVLKAARSRLIIPELTAEDVEEFARVLAEGKEP